MTTPLEFSKTYKLLNEIKEGNKSKQEELNLILNEYKQGDNVESFLHELAQTFLYIGINEIYTYTNVMDLFTIGQFSKEKWDELANKNKGEFPVHLANTMIKYFKDNQLSEKLSSKWKKSMGEIEKHVMPMSRYITEGLIDVLE